MKKFTLEQSQVWFGSCPEVYDLLFLRRNGVGVVWNLLDGMKHVLEIEKKYISVVIHTPTEDFNIPNRERFLEDLDRVWSLIQQGKHIFVHCLAGQGRTGIAITGLLFKYGFDLTESLALTYSLCRGPERDVQREFLQDIYRERFQK